MASRIYSIGIRGLDTKDFERNPLVFSRHEYEPKYVIGRAEILKYKTKVRVEFIGEVPENYGLGITTYQENLDRPKLYAMVMIPKYYV